MRPHLLGSVRVLTRACKRAHKRETMARAAQTPILPLHSTPPAPEIPERRSQPRHSPNRERRTARPKTARLAPPTPKTARPRRRDPKRRDRPRLPRNGESSPANQARSGLKARGRLLPPFRCVSLKARPLLLIYMPFPFSDFDEATSTVLPFSEKP